MLKNIAKIKKDASKADEADPFWAHEHQEEKPKKVDKDPFEIAMTLFSFQNSKILKLLHMRGLAIRSGDAKQILEVGK